MLNSINYSLPDKLENAVQKQLGEWKKENAISRIWSKDESFWTNEDETKWLGWLDSVEAELSKIQEYRDFAEDIKKRWIYRRFVDRNGRFKFSA
jgi:hypothetical protein